MIDDEEIMESDDLDYADDDFVEAEEPDDGGKRDQQSRDWMLTIRAMDHTEDEVKALCSSAKLVARPNTSTSSASCR